MKKRFLLMITTTAIMLLGMSQNVMAKKITYLGHYYNGKVNKQKIPEGEGDIAIADVAILGTFNANNITHAKIEEDWIKISGAISFDESDRITVKAGSIISSNVYSSSSIKEIRSEDDLKNNRWVMSHVFQKKLKKDSIVDLASTHADFYVSTKMGDFVPNPPTVISQVPAELVPIEISYDVKDIWGKKTGQTAKRQTKIYKIEKKIEEYRLDNYKDEFGRIWNVSGPQNNGVGCIGKVVYPNGDYVETDGWGDIDDLEVKKNGFVIKKGLIIFSDSVKIYFDDSRKSNYIFRYYISDSTIANATLGRIDIPQSQISRLSNKDITTLINEKISQVFADYKFDINCYDSNMKRFSGMDVYDGNDKVGKFDIDEGKYVSYKEQRAEKGARDASRNRSIADFKKKYGFDPSVDNARYVVKVGRNLIGVVDERNAWIVKYHEELDRYGNTGIITVSLEIDKGSRKCFKFYYNGYYCGYIWVNNKTITSVTWE